MIPHEGECTDLGHKCKDEQIRHISINSPMPLYRKESLQRFCKDKYGKDRRKRELETDIEEQMR